VNVLENLYCYADLYNYPYHEHRNHRHDCGQFAAIFDKRYWISGFGYPYVNANVLQGNDEANL